MLSTHRAWAGVIGARGSNGPGRGDDGAGSGVGFGLGGIVATGREPTVGCELCVQDAANAAVNTKVAAGTARVAEAIGRMIGKLHAAREPIEDLCSLVLVVR